MKMALLQFFLGFCLYQTLPAIAQQIPQKCSPDEVTLVNLENQYGIKASELNLNVMFDRLDILGETSTRNVTEIFLKSADIIVSGHVYHKENKINSKVARSFNVNSVTVQVTKQDSEQQLIPFSCKITGGKYLSERNVRSRSYLTPQERIEFVLRDLTNYCLEIQICEHFNAILSKAFLISDFYEEKSEVEPDVSFVPQEPIIDETYPRSLINDQEKSLQNAINSFFDFGVSAGITKFVDSDGFYRLPDVATNFEAAGSTGDFKTSDGTFEGLTTIRRVKDIVFTSKKNHFSMGTTIRLSKAVVNIPSYHGRYGIVNIDGSVVLHIAGISLTIKVSVNYNSTPCKLHLEEMKIHDVGDINVDITGLGWPLNGILEPVIRRIIRTSVFEKAEQRIAEQASRLDCEKYRPTFEMLKN